MDYQDEKMFTILVFTEKHFTRKKIWDEIELISKKYPDPSKFLLALSSEVIKQDELFGRNYKNLSISGKMYKINVSF